MCFKKSCSASILNELDMLKRVFKLCPHMAPGAIRLNHIPDMPLRSSVFSSLQSCPEHSCVLD